MGVGEGAGTDKGAAGQSVPGQDAGKSRGRQGPRQDVIRAAVEVVNGRAVEGARAWAQDGGWMDG